MSSRNVSSILDFRFMKTPEGDGQKLELEHLAKADVHARNFLISQPLLNEEMCDDPAIVRLEEAVEELAGRPARPEADEEIDLRDQLAWGYRIGLCVGLRLARAIAKDRE